MDSCDKLFNRNHALRVTDWNIRYQALCERNEHWAGSTFFGDNYFPYDGVCQWVIDYLADNLSKTDDEHFKFVKRCICFLCNVICVSTQCNLPEFIKSFNFNSTIL